MVANLCMLAAMMAAVVLCSFFASLIPGRPVPEVVFFVVAGVVLGPGCLGIVSATTGLDLVGRLGMGLLFLMAGYELDLRELTGAMGRHAALCWAVSFGAALLLTPALGLGLDQTGVAAFSIALTTTAYGTLVPIMRDRELGGTSVGEVIESYGAMGEILPVVAMSLLLSPSRSLGANVAVLVGFVAFCVFVASRGRWAAEMGSRLSRFLHENAESSEQPGLLVGFMALLLLIRALPLLASLALSPETRTMPLGEKISASLYCTMALPLIVALTEAAAACGAMDEQMASVLVCAGALTVLVIPIITSLSVRAVAAHPVDAVHEVMEHPHDLREIVHEHHVHAHEVAEELREERRHLHEEGVQLSSADFLARRAELRRRHRRR